jgi:hypothetical protein
MATTALEEVIDRAERIGFSNAATLLRFAAKLVDADIEVSARWVVIRAIDAAEQELRDTVSDGADMNVVDSRLAALRLRLGISGVRDIFTAGSIDAADDDAVGVADALLEQILENAAKACYRIAFQDNGTRA